MELTQNNLQAQKSSYSNKLIFKNGKSCDIDWIAKIQ